MPYFAFQLCQDQQVVGYCIGLVVMDEATLMDIGVRESYRGKGYGKKLLQHFNEQCIERAVDEIWLEVRQSNAAAIRLYSDFGYQIVELRKNYYPIDNGTEHALIMKSVLPKSP